MKVVHTLHLFLALVFLLPVAVIAQTDEIENSDCYYTPAAEPTVGNRFSLGAFGSFNFTTHSTDMRTLASGTEYGNSSGTNFSAGVLVDIPLSRRFALYLRGGYHSHNARFSTSDSVGIIMGNSPVPVVIDHTLDATLSSIAVEPLVRFRPTEALSLLAGGRVGFVVVSDYEYREMIREPLDVVFETGTRERGSSGELADAASVEAAAIGGIGYTISLMQKNGVSLFLVPEVTYSLGLTDLVKNASWSTSSLRIGMAFVYLRWR